jgi:hypothetical protein
MALFSYFTILRSSPVEEESFVGEWKMDPSTMAQLEGNDDSGGKQDYGSAQGSNADCVKNITACKGKSDTYQVSRSEETENGTLSHLALQEEASPKCLTAENGLALTAAKIEKRFHQSGGASDCHQLTGATADNGAFHRYIIWKITVAKIKHKMLSPLGHGEPMALHRIQQIAIKIQAADYIAFVGMESAGGADDSHDSDSIQWSQWEESQFEDLLTHSFLDGDSIPAPKSTSA